VDDSVIQRILRHSTSSNHPESLHQDDIAQCDRQQRGSFLPYCAPLMFQMAILARRFCSMGLGKCLPMSELAEREGFSSCHF
jgi:hypothetical protein